MEIPASTETRAQQENGERQGDGIRLGQAITQLSTQIHTANCRLLRLIGEFDRCGGWRQQATMRSCAHWLAAHCGITLGAAREKVRVARQLEFLPDVEEAFAAGELSYSKVRAVTRVARPDNEAFLLHLAQKNSAGHLEKLLSRFEPVPEPGLEDLLDSDPGQSLANSPWRAGDPGCGGDAGELAAHGAGACGNAGNAGNSVIGASETEEAGGSQGQPENASTGADGQAAVAPEQNPAAASETPQLDPEIARELAREAYWFQDKDGMWIIHAKLPPEQGQLVMKALQAVVRPIEEARQDAWKARQKSRMQAVARKLLQRYHAVAGLGGKSGTTPMATGDGDVDSLVRESREADSFASAPLGVDGPGHDREITGSRPASPANTDSRVAAPEAVTPEVDPDTGAWVDQDGSRYMPLPNHLLYTRAEEKISAETFSRHMDQVRADALVAMVEHFLASAPDYAALQGLKGAERCQVVMHVDLNTLREQRSGACCTHSRAHFEDKPWLSAATARRLSCDASLVTVLEDDAGKVLNVGRRSRIVPAPIRRALRERDGVCQYPGCQESEYVDAHHIQHWSEGGETRLDNLVTLCRFHHRELHRGCFDIRLKGDTAEVFRQKSAGTPSSTGATGANATAQPCGKGENASAEWFDRAQKPSSSRHRGDLSRGSGSQRATPQALNRPAT
ncbi:HNH endonuclease signature motif containing protein [Haliea atlantica]